MTRQKLGQHFLADLSWRKRILQTLRVARGESWLEIGAGHGEMTELLARAGARVVAIETDSELAEGLAERSAAWGSVQVVPGDVLQLDLPALAGGGVRVYGNLAYYITSPILRHLFAAADRITSIDIVIQFEVAARIPPGAFRPPPEVPSRLVTMSMPGERATLGIADEPHFLEFLQTCFGQKRKTLRNNLRGLASGAKIEAALQKHQIPPTARAEELTLAQFAAMYHAIQKM